MSHDTFFATLEITFVSHVCIKRNGEGQEYKQKVNNTNTYIRICRHGPTLFNRTYEFFQAVAGAPCAHSSPAGRHYR
jgi:hypothetical protein